MKTLSSLLIAIVVGSSAAKAQGPQLLVRNPRGGEAPLHVEDVVIDIKVAGDVAETTITVGFRNETKRMLEGDFVMPLPAGATVSSYALEVNGAMREGVAVEKERARHAYESIKRRMIDPGLVEREAGNVYRTRIFPILANSVKRVRLGYVEHLAEATGKKHHYELPLAFPTPVATFSCQIEGEGEVGLDLVERPGVQFTQEPSGRLASRVTNKKIKGKLVLNITAPDRPSTLVETNKLTDESFFHLTDRVPDHLAIPSRPAPKRILLVWDASESRHNQEKELALLDAWFKKIGFAAVHLQVLRNTVREHGVFAVRNGQWKKLRSFLEDGTSDGSTRLDLLPLNEVLEDIVLLCTDGAVPFGLPAEPPNKPIYVLNGANRPVHPSLAAYARQSMGVVVELGRLEADAALGRLANHTLRIVSVEGHGVHSCHYNAEISPEKPVRISGGLKGDGPHTVRVNYGYGDTILATTNATVGGKDAGNSTFPRRLWAQAVLADLEAAHSVDDDRIIAHCKRHGLVSDLTSLIVLERFEDHLRYEIPPPEPDLRKRYDQALAKKTPPKLEDGLHRVVRQWRWKQEWYQKEFPWMDIALLPRLQQVTIWTQAVGKIFDNEQIDQAAFNTIDQWRKDTLAVIDHGKQIKTNEKMRQWSRQVGQLVERGANLRTTPVQPPKAGKPLVVSVRGLVKAPGTISGGTDLTLRQAIAKAGGIHQLGSKSNVELYRNAGKTVYNMASKKFEDVPLKPGDMIVVEQEYDPYDYGVADDPFSDTPVRRFDPSEEPPVIEDSDLWISDRDGVDDDPFAGSSARAARRGVQTNTPTSRPSDLSAKLGGTIRIGANTTVLSPTMEKFAQALAKGGDPQSAYYQLRKPGRYPASFYVEAARLLFAHNQPQLAEQVLSNLLEAPALDLERILATAMWLGEFGRWSAAKDLLNHARKQFPEEILLSYHRAMVAKQLDEQPVTFHEILKMVRESGFPHHLAATIAQTDINGTPALRNDAHWAGVVPADLRGNLEADLRIVVMSSNPVRAFTVAVREPSGHTCYASSPCGGRIERFSGLDEYMIRRAMPGNYTITGESQQPMTVRTIIYRNWGHENQTSQAVTVLLDGTGAPVTIAEHYFIFGE